MTAEPAARPAAAIAVSTLVRRDGRILLVRRGREPNRGLWAFPGGKLEPGETPAEAAAREVREEAGIAVRDLERLETLDVSAGEPQVRFKLVVFRADADAGTAIAGDDAAEVRWTRPEDLAALPLVKEVRSLLARHGLFGT